MFGGKDTQPGDQEIPPRARRRRTLIKCGSSVVEEGGERRLWIVTLPHEHLRPPAPHASHGVLAAVPVAPPCPAWAPPPSRRGSSLTGGGDHRLRRCSSEEGSDDKATIGSAVFSGASTAVPNASLRRVSVPRTPEGHQRLASTGHHKNLPSGEQAAHSISLFVPVSARCCQLCL